MNKCLICGTQQKEFLKGKDYFLNTSNKEFNLIKCEKCGLEQIYPIPNIEEIIGFYKSDYYSYQENNISKIEKFRDLIFKVIYSIVGVNHKLLNINNYNNGVGNNFLEIGCGSGGILKLMKLNGYNTEGFEIGMENKKIGDIYYGDSIVNIDFGKKYDLIYISHVFEHLSNPLECLIKINELLTEDGKCIVILPNIDCLNSRLFKNLAVERDIPRHLFNYNFQNFQKLVSNNGFNISYKGRMRNYGLFDSFNHYLKFKYNLDISNNFFGKILRMFTTLFIENILNLFRSTNQMGFIISKK